MFGRGILFAGVGKLLHGGKEVLPSPVNCICVSICISTTQNTMLAKVFQIQIQILDFLESENTNTNTNTFIQYLNMTKYKY